jgi:methylglyoxal synthase
MIGAEQWHHDIDVKALLRMSVPCNIPTAYFIILSILFQEAYTPILKD